MSQTLTAPQRQVLDRLSRSPAYSVRNGWSFRGGPRFTRLLANALFAAGLLKVEGSQLSISEAGRRALSPQPPAPLTIVRAERKPTPRPFRSRTPQPAPVLARAWWVD